MATHFAAAQGAKPTDPQIAHIAYTAGVIDIKAAQLALKKSKNKEVVAFAKDMVRDHGAVNQKALALVKRLNVTPQDNDTSKGLVQTADTERATLAKLRGAESTRPMRQTRSAITRRSTARSKACLFQARATRS